MELRGFEPLTFSLRTRRATNCAIAPRTGLGPISTQTLPPSGGGGLEPFRRPVSAAEAWAAAGGASAMTGTRWVGRRADVGPREVDGPHRTRGQGLGHVGRHGDRHGVPEHADFGSVTATAPLRHGPPTAMAVLRLRNTVFSSLPWGCPVAGIQALRMKARSSGPPRRRAPAVRRVRPQLHHGISSTAQTPITALSTAIRTSSTRRRRRTPPPLQPAKIVDRGPSGLRGGDLERLDLGQILIKKGSGAVPDDPHRFGEPLDRGRSPRPARRPGRARSEAPDKPARRSQWRRRSLLSSPHPRPYAVPDAGRVILSGVSQKQPVT